ncbi:MAG TPA: 2-keto-4-pentenoate hydratase, partial [Terriglobia bacterium]|nr:2-keto-4-pentenoate hydratase [Terriglobia bacterium]
GHPLRSLYWLVNFLSGRGQALQAGAVVTTGSYAGVIDAPLDTPLALAYGTLGKFNVEFRPL